MHPETGKPVKEQQKPRIQILSDFLSGCEENKRWTLSLCNTIHVTSYGSISAVTINTTEDAAYIGMKNELPSLFWKS